MRKCCLQGPFIHVAATVGTLISKLTASCNKGVYANESRYSEMLATACAVGVSCTFSAPVGGTKPILQLPLPLFIFTLSQVYSSPSKSLPSILLCATIGAPSSPPPAAPSSFACCASSYSRLTVLSSVNQSFFLIYHRF